MANRVYNYAILAIRLNDYDWVEIIETKDSARRKHASKYLIINNE